MSLRDDPKARFHVFDLDRTIVEQNSSFAFLGYLCRHRVLSHVVFLQAFLARARANLLNLSLRQVHEILFQQVLKGVRFDELEGAVDGFLREFLWSSLYPPVFSVLRREQHLGGKIAIMSSSPSFLVKKIAPILGVDVWVATEYVVDSMGRLKEINRFLDGVEKAAELRQLSQVHKCSFEKVKAYSDSYHDIPFLLAAGSAVAVNPDRRLRHFAKTHHWEIL